MVFGCITIDLVILFMIECIFIMFQNRRKKDALHQAALWKMANRPQFRRPPARYFGNFPSMDYQRFMPVPPPHYPTKINDFINNNNNPSTSTHINTGLTPKETSSHQTDAHISNSSGFIEEAAASSGTESDSVRANISRSSFSSRTFESYDSGTNDSPVKSPPYTSVSESSSKMANASSDISKVDYSIDASLLEDVSDAESDETTNVAVKTSNVSDSAVDLALPWRKRARFRAEFANEQPGEQLNGNQVLPLQAAGEPPGIFNLERSNNSYDGDSSSSDASLADHVSPKKRFMAIRTSTPLKEPVKVESLKRGLSPELNIDESGFADGLQNNPNPAVDNHGQQSPVYYRPKKLRCPDKKVDPNIDHSEKE